MANNTNLKTAIQDVIKANGNNEITGPILQSSLLSIINQLGQGAQFMGVATPDTVPVSTDANVFYLAATPGVYPNFAGFTLTKGIAVLSNKTGAWVGTAVDIPNNTDLRNIAAGENVVAFYQGGYVNTSGGISTEDASLHKYILIPAEEGDKFLYVSDRSNNLCAWMSSPTVQINRFTCTTGNNELTAPAGTAYLAITLEFTPGGGSKQGNYKNQFISKLNAFNQGIATLTNQVAENTGDIAELNTNVEALENVLTSSIGERVNKGENTATPDAFPTSAQGLNAFSISISEDTESPTKDMVGFKHTFLNTTTPNNQSCFRTYGIPVGTQRPTSIGVAMWVKKSEWQAIYTNVSAVTYLHLVTFRYNNAQLLTGIPQTIVGDVGSSPAFDAAKCEISIIATKGDYIRVRFLYFDLVYKSSFTGTVVNYYFTFNENTSLGNPLTVTDITVLLDDQPIGKIVYPDGQSLIGTPSFGDIANQVANNTGDIAELKSAIFGDEVIVKKVGDNLYIASNWDATRYLVKNVLFTRASSFTQNPNANFVREYLALKNGNLETSVLSIKESGDDITPAHLNGSYIGGNHSWNHGFAVTANAHGKTLADVGSVYKNGADVEFVILRIVDANTLWMISKNQAVDGFTYSFVAPSGTLTYVSNGTNTGDIIISSVAGLGNMYTTVKPATVKLLLNGTTEITEDGTYKCAFFDIVENYDVADLTTLINGLINGRPSGGYLAQPQLNQFGDKLFNHNLTYRFTDNGNTIVFTNFKAIKKLNFNFHGFIQSGAVANGFLYCPKSLPINDGVATRDFRNKEDWSSGPATNLYLSEAYWEDPNSPPDRVLNFNANVNLLLGYITDRGAQTNRKDVVSNSMFFATSRKVYPMGVSKPITLEPNSFYSTVAYRCYTNPANNPAGRTNFSYVELGNDVFIFVDYHGALDDNIPVKNEWIGKKLEVYEQNNRVTVIGDVVSGPINIVSTADASTYGYAVLKLS